MCITINKQKTMEKEELEVEHAHIKKMLEDVNWFVNSKGFYSLPYQKKQLMTVKKAALETYLKTLSIELWGEETETVDLSQLMMAGIATAFNPSIPSVTSPKE